MSVPKSIKPNPSLAPSGLKKATQVKSGKVPNQNNQSKLEDKAEYEPPFTEKDFWEIVDFIDWKNLSKNRRETDKNFMNYKLVCKFGRKFCHNAYEVERDKIAALDQISDTYEYVEGISNRKCFGGNDGWWDTRSHIVGLGKEEFMKNVRNPELIMKRWKDGDYVENFGYWIPKEDTEIEIPNSIKFAGVKEI